MVSNDLIFALDIGTRTVIGIVGKEEEGKLNIISAEIVEHKSRAMMDGQVHDIEKVADAVIEAKTKLENKLGIKLGRAAIAAAGRVLKTKQVYIENAVSSEISINSENISSLEMEGIQLAQYELDEELFNDEKVVYYCVGYSVISYYLNNYVISNLIGHKGKKIGADIIATFLPNTVVDSLYEVMKLAHLEVSNLTLEPIAAINVAIPKDLRLLNLALVDIGAGTSDIAITKEGSIVGFDMVPLAGDEITEAICHSYIVDFKTAERIKTSKTTLNEEINYIDIMGINKTTTYKEVMEVIAPATQNLAETIADKIVEFNKKSPQAVFLIGGGSQVYNLEKLIAEKLKLPYDRVAVRKSEIIQNVKINESILEGPDAITPIGIAVTALMEPEYGFIKVKVNNIKIRLFNSRRLHVSDAMILAEIKPTELIGKNGKVIRYELNGVWKNLMGSLAEPAEISVNGYEANIQAQISNGDNIIIKPAKDGISSVLNVKTLLKNYSNKCEIFVNGNIINGDYYVKNEDHIEIAENIVNDVIDNMEKVDEGIIEKSVLDDEDLNNSKNIIDNEKAVSKSNVLTINVIVNNKNITLNKKTDNYIFVDIFNYYEFDLKTLRGRLITKLNGESASFTEILKDGDKVEIYWE